MLAHAKESVQIFALHFCLALQEPVKRKVELSMCLLCENLSSILFKPCGHSALCRGETRVTCGDLLNEDWSLHVSQVRSGFSRFSHLPFHTSRFCPFDQLQIAENVLKSAPNVKLQSRRNGGMVSTSSSIDPLHHLQWYQATIATNYRKERFMESGRKGCSEMPFDIIMQIVLASPPPSLSLSLCLSVSVSLNLWQLIKQLLAFAYRVKMNQQSLLFFPSLIVISLRCRHKTVTRWRAASLYCLDIKPVHWYYFLMICDTTVSYNQKMIYIL